MMLLRMEAVSNGLGCGADHPSGISNCMLVLWTWLQANWQMRLRLIAALCSELYQWGLWSSETILARLPCFYQCHSPPSAHKELNGLDWALGAMCLAQWLFHLLFWPHRLYDSYSVALSARWKLCYSQVPHLSPCCNCPVGNWIWSQWEDGVEPERQKGISNRATSAVSMAQYKATRRVWPSAEANSAKVNCRVVPLALLFCQVLSASETGSLWGWLGGVNVSALVQGTAHVVLRWGSPAALIHWGHRWFTWPFYAPPTNAFFRSNCWSSFTQYQLKFHLMRNLDKQIFLSKYTFRMWLSIWYLFYIQSYSGHPWSNHLKSRTKHSSTRFFCSLSELYILYMLN